MSTTHWFTFTPYTVYIGKDLEEYFSDLARNDDWPSVVSEIVTTEIESRNLYELADTVFAILTFQEAVLLISEFRRYEEKARQIAEEAKRTRDTGVLYVHKDGETNE